MYSQTDHPILQVKLCQAHEEETKQLFRVASQSALTNVKQSKRQRVKEFKIALISLAELEVESVLHVLFLTCWLQQIQIGQDSERRWREVLELMKNA